MAFWLLTIPRPIPALAPHTPNPANGALLFDAAGCISCHKPNPGVAGFDPALPSGGAPFKTPIGTLYPPNLTPDAATGIGNWTELEFVNAVQRGISRTGQHLIPAFPYTSYAKMPASDVLDIRAHLMRLAPVSSAAPPHDFPAPFILRRGLGLWKWLGFTSDPWKPEQSQSPGWNRGSYLVNGPGHCGECHTPRNIFMAADPSRFLMGGPHPEGSGKVPSLHRLIESGRYKNEADLVLAFQNGEIFGYENISAGGMGQVQRNLARLPPHELAAIAEYLASLN